MLYGKSGKDNTVKTLALYFSYAGHTRNIAEAEAAESGADIAEIKTARRLGMFRGILKAMLGKTTKIQPLTVNLSDYDTIKLYSPIWAGNPHAAANAALALLPSGKNIEIAVVSSSGTSKCRERIAGIVKAKGCTLTGFRDIKASS